MQGLGNLTGHAGDPCSPCTPPSHTRAKQSAVPAQDCAAASPNPTACPWGPHHQHVQALTGGMRPGSQREEGGEVRNCLRIGGGRQARRAQPVPIAEMRHSARRGRGRAGRPPMTVNEEREGWGWQVSSLNPQEDNSSPSPHPFHSILSLGLIRVE